MIATNTFTYRTAPQWADETFATVSVPLERVEARPAGKRPKGAHGPAKYLLIGFDTEYQSIDAVTQQQIDGGEARNEVLSYQFWIKLLTREAEADARETSGIIVPDEGERISMAEFFVAAVGTFATEHSLESLPSDILLVGHFTRADLPAFEDFRQNAKDFFSNVRNTFVSIDMVQKIELKDERSGDTAEFHIKLRDTLLLAPANAKSLMDIGEIVGFPKLMLGGSREADQHIKENMKGFRRDHWSEFREYAIRDAEVCVRYAEKLIRQYQKLFNKFQMPLTLSQFGVGKVLQDWDALGWDKEEILGTETIRERKWSKRLGRYISSEKTVYRDCIYFDVAFVNETYHGGRNEQFAFGICAEGRWRDHDLSSAYPTAMSLIGAPNWSATEQLTSLDDVALHDLAYAAVDFEFPSDVRFPILPVRTDGGIIFPRRGTSYCAAPELSLAKELGAKLTLRRGVRVPADRGTRVFRGFIKECVDERGKHRKNTFENLFWKEVGNSTYGKTAQGLREKRVYDLREADMVSLPPSKLTQPFFASYITSFVRAVLGEVLNAFPEQVDVFSVTTDGFLSNASDDDVAVATAGKLFKVFADARAELDPKSQALEVKHEIAQPIGWRTRGSATLKSFDGDPVLQKGGIKTNRLFDPEQDNRFIVDLFLNRQAGQRVDYTTGLGLKVLVNADADFVSRSTSKRLSMEFDWKRLPQRPVDRTAHFCGREVSHLSFSTSPLEDIRQFQSLRAAWERYDEKPRKVLKSIKDFDVFWSYWKTEKLPHQVTNYLSKQNGAIKRLRRDLTMAFKSHSAGFDKVRSRLKLLAHAEFAEQLVTCGIPCTVTDVENGKRKPFQPYQSVRTDETAEALSRLKREFYPELEIDRFFAEEP